MVSLTEIEEASRNISAAIRRTPAIPSWDFQAGHRVMLKLENMQKTGSFKERGALFKLQKLRDAKASNEVVAASAGNHAQAVALHAATVGFKASIFMPRWTALTKVSSTQKWGAKVVLEGESFDEAIEAGRSYALEHKLPFIHAFDDEDIIRGQGSLGVEILEQVPQARLIVVPVGGGGLASGVAIAVKGKNPKCRVIGVAAENYPRTQAAFHGRNPTGNPTDNPPTLADGICMKEPGKITLPLLRKYLDDLVTVSEDAMAETILSLMERGKILAEGAGAASLAAVISGAVKGADTEETVCVISGGNIDVNMISRIIEKGLLHTGRLARMEVVVSDRPGGLHAMTAVLKDLRANILQIQHERASSHIPLYTTGTELTLEIRGDEHLQEILTALRAGGFRVTLKD